MILQHFWLESNRLESKSCKGFFWQIKFPPMRDLEFLMVMWLLSTVIIKSSNWKPPLNLVICEIWGVEVHLDICLSSDENDNFVCEERLSCTRNRKSITFLRVSRSWKKLSSRHFSQKTNGCICFSILTVRKYLKLEIEIQVSDIYGVSG